MNLALFISALIALACISFSKISSKLGLPTLLIFMLIGMFFGSEGLIGLPFSNFALAEEICTIGLIFIMFYGGFGTSWKFARPYAFQASVLSSAGTIITAVVVAACAYYLLNLKPLEAFLLGAVISSTDAASVFNILRSRKLNLKRGLAPLLEIESGSNDPFAYLLTFVAILLLSSTLSIANTALMVLQQISFALIIGAAIGFAACKILEYVSFGNDGSDTIFIVSVALLSFALPSLVGGNGYLSVYLAGIIIGNSHIAHKIELVHFFDGLTALSQMLIFFLFGLLCFPSRLNLTLIPGIIVMLCLTFLARPLAMSLLLKPFGRSWKELCFVSAAGLRGAASMVFAIMAIVQLNKAASPLNFDLFHTVFWVVIFSIALQGSVIAILAQRLDLVDDSESVMKTFTDYAEEEDFHLVELMVQAQSPWDKKKLQDIKLPYQALAVLLKRGEETIIPQGSTELLAGDIILMNCPQASSGVQDLELSEVVLGKHHPWINHLISELDLSPHALIVLIKRGDESISPKADIRLLRGDKLVISGTLTEKPEFFLKAKNMR